MPPDASLDAFCRRILERGDLPSKLVPPRGINPDSPENHGSPTPLAPPPKRPARESGLEMRGGAAPLPRPGELADPALRAICLARFAHHELMAVELFAWALLRWPEVPAGLQTAWLAALADEQIHCGLYLARLADLGTRLEEHPQSDYFWKQIPGIEASPHGPRAFLAGLGLTLEQANLDFTGVYRDAFRRAGDEASARVFERVYRDEIQHVALAARWMERLSPEFPDDPVGAYEDAVPYPLAASRAKGRRFNVAGRRAAGLGERFIEHVRNARSSQELASAHKRQGENSSPR